MPIAPRTSVASWIATAAVALLAFASPVASQSLSFGELNGSVSAALSRPLNGAEVRVREKSSGAIRWVVTTRDGRFRFAVLPAGRYDVTVEALGYRPVVHTDVTIAAGHAAILATTLKEAAPPVTTVDTVRAATDAADSGIWLFDRGYTDLLGTRRLASDAAALTTTADEFSVEGLPWRLTETMIDGSRSAGIGAPGGTGADAAALAFPIRSVSSAVVGGLGFDVEAGGTGVGVRATTRRAGGTPESRALIEGGTTSYGGSFIAGGPLQGDTAQAIIGVDYQRSEVSRPTHFGENAAFGAALTDAAQNTYSTNISAYGPPDRLDERWSGFGRLDWQPGDRFAVSVRASGSRLTSAGLAEPVGLAGLYGTNYEATGAQASLSVYARLTRRIAQEFRVGADIGQARSGAPDLPSTSFAGAGFTLGGAAAQPFEDSRMTPRVSGALYVDLGAHRVKTGFALASHRFDSRYVPGASGQYRYGDVADFVAGEGTWRRVEGASPVGEFQMSESAFFVQDAWRVADGLSVTLGARLDGTQLPAGDIQRNAQWFAQTGLDNRSLAATRSRVSPRLGLRWELGSQREWVLEGGAGVFQDLPDRRDIAEALTFDEGAPVRYGAGTISSWPAAPDAASVPVVGNTITMLGPDFEGPRTQRLALGITRRFGRWSSSVSGVYRHTDYLARRRDLNLPATAPGQDQYGRPLYGSLRQMGTLLAAVPRTNRRFGDFDAVHVLESTGFSDYWAVTLGVERVREQGLSLGMSYSFGNTTDNVPGFGVTHIAPFADGLAGVDWTEGTSDLDVPHRLLVAADWSWGTEGAFRLGTIYRLSSGLPFTPGVRYGVDANGDGDGMNDPAFVDLNLPGMGAVLEQWSCLRTEAGAFAVRNACRGDLAHRVDLRASFRIATLAIGRLDLVLDALDVVAAESGRTDHALMLVDRTRSVSTDPLSGVTTVPFVVNPNFGQILADRSPGVLWRVGLRIVP